MKKHEQIQKHTLVLHIAVLTILCILLVSAMLFYSDTLENSLYSDSVAKLGEISEQNVKVLNNQVTAQINSMTEVAERITVPTDWNIDYTIFTLNRVMERYPFKRMGIIFKDGSSYFTDGSSYAMTESEMENMSPVFEGETIILGPYHDILGYGEIISLQVPVYKNNEVNAVLVASYGTSTLQEMLSVSFFSGQGYSYIVHANGDIVADSDFPTSFRNVHNIFDSILGSDSSNAAAAEEMKRNMQFNEDGYIMFRNKVDKYMYYSFAGINDWYLLSVIPASVIDSTQSDIMISTYFLCTVICGIFFFVVLLYTKLERAKRQELQNILYVDPITKGYSYQRFCLEAKERLKTDSRSAAIVVLDIEKFKVINEMFGYDEGDKVLRYIWSLMERWVRDGEIYARWIADRFDLLAFYESEEELVRRLSSLADDIMSDRTERRNGFVLYPVIGVYRVIDRSLEIETMQNYASIAHSTIKGGADNRCIAFYDEEYKTAILNNKILEDKLVSALEKKEFEVFYQPKYNTATAELAGAEALIRWRNPDGTYIPPFQFIPTAEKNGFIINLDKYVFKQVCDNQRELMDKGVKIVPVSVNLSRQHLHNSRFIEDYRRIIDVSGVPIEMVELEITESAMFENQNEFISIIDNLHKVGFRILMDDFGTGYSSLMMLKSIPIDVMKLDKSFVDDFNDVKGERIISNVVQLAKALNIEVTAEGVETEEQYQFMKKLGCDLIQGYYFSKPLPKSEFDKLLKPAEEASV